MIEIQNGPLTLNDFEFSKPESKTIQCNLSIYYPVLDYSKWVICRVYERSCSTSDEQDGGMELSCLDEVFLSLDDDDEISNCH
ncbi:NAC domain-containing protein 104-like protein [Gossypium australe]|uniref:NAC domain-containing protein 104-like protein n=1 Tax=Gossypium australe TaxID=47621 RepID=A0A5B6X2X7_9ROSI|nr:NAC domain-containing protein 104-like protein [Gossypium australe]